MAIFCAVVVISLSVAFWHSAASNPFDRTLDKVFLSPHGTGTRPLFSIITTIGSPDIAFPAAILVAVASWAYFRRLRLALFTPALFAVTAVLARLLKIAVARQRAHTPAVTDASLYAFPSGHAAAVGAVMFSAAVLVLLSGRRHRRLVAVGLVMAGVIGGVSRLVIGAHYATDVVGGLALALVVVASATASILAKPRSRP